MNAKNENVTTPKQTKRLGLSRNSRMFRNNSARRDEESSTRPNFLEFNTPETTTKSRLSQSDVKVNYKKLEQKATIYAMHAVTTPGTPKNNCISDLQKLSVSTNCRPYRLALSKKTREKMTKKRLEFYVANAVEKQDEEVPVIHDQHKNIAEENPNPKDDLIQKIETAHKELNSRQRHEEKVQELRNVINVWKTGFSAALLDLQQKIEPRLETAILLDRLQIPQDMIKYIDQ